MRRYNKITIWENARRLAMLYKFRDLVNSYFENIEYSYYSPSENQEAKKARLQINRLIKRVAHYVLLSGIDPSLTVTPPPAVGGYVRNIDCIYNVFHLHQYQIGSDVPIDFIDRAIGVYEGDRTAALIRTFNPFFWLGILFDFILSIPYRILDKLGFNSAEVEKSFIGKIINAVMFLVTLISGLVTIMQGFGWMGVVNDFVIQLVKAYHTKNNL